MADENVSYKSITNVEKFISNFWKNFPSIILETTPQVGKIPANYKNIIVRPFLPLLQENEEFCKLLDKNIIDYGRPISSGSFGRVSNLIIFDNIDITTNKKEPKLIYAVAVSLIPDNNITIKYEIFYMPVVIKTTKSPKSLLVEYEKTSKFMIIKISDPFSEAIFGGLASNIFDLGLTPLPMKTFGFYMCKDKTVVSHYNISSILEKNDGQFVTLLNRNEPFMKDYTFDFFIDLLIQYIYGMFCLKYYYGFVHFDTHLGNIMIKFPNDFLYHGKDLGALNYIMYQFPFINSVTKENYSIITSLNLVVKLIDFGFCLANFDYSNKNKVPMVYSTIPPGLINDENAVKRAIDNKAYANTVDIYFTLLCFYYQLKLGLDDQKSGPSPEQTNLLKNMMPFLDEMFRSDIYTGIEDYITKNNIEMTVRKSATKTVRTSTGKTAQFSPGKTIQQPTKEYFWTFANHDVGTEEEMFSDVLIFLRKINKYFIDKNHSYKKVKLRNANDKIFEYSVVSTNITSLPDINPGNTLYLNLRNTTHNSLSTFMEYYTKYYSSCIAKLDDVLQQEFKTDNCNDIKNIINTYDPSLIQDKWLFLNVVRNDSAIWDKKYNTVKQDTNINQLSDFTFYIGKFIGFNLTFYPAQIKMSDMVYNSEYIWINKTPIPPQLSGEYIEIINMNILSVKKIDNILVNINENMWSAANNNLKKYKSGFTISCNSVITKDNINNKLTPYINDSHLNMPLGYYYNEKDISRSGTLLPIPEEYKYYYAAIILTNTPGVTGETNLNLDIVPYSDFVDHHATIEIPTLISVLDSTPSNPDLESTETLLTKVISVDKGKSYGGSPDIDKVPYSLAFVAGPILIQNKQPIFEFDYYDKDFTKINQMNVIDFYKVASQANNTRMFSSEPYEEQFPYNQRNSNHITNRSVLAKDEDGNILVIIIEGEGYDSPGLPVDLLTKLISKFNINFAVLLNNGYNTNVVIKKEDYIENMWLFPRNNTESKDLCLTFAFN